jgi:hypothetical protein
MRGTACQFAEFAVVAVAGMAFAAAFGSTASDPLRPKQEPAHDNGDPCGE